MRRVDENPEVGELWQLFDPTAGAFFDGYVVKRTKKQWKLLDIADLSLVTVPNVIWFWARIA